MTKVFVTGGSGYVGRNLIRHLRQRGDEVHALARSNVAVETVSRLGAAAVQGDLDDVAGLRQGMTGCELVFHAAATVTEWGPRKLFREVNVSGTANVLTAAKSAGVRKFIHVSTEAVLCDGTPLLNVDELRSLPLNPLPRYPETKGAAEVLVRETNSARMECVIVRPRLIWGNDDTSVLAALVAAVKAGRFMWMDGGRYLTSSTHVDNVCEGLLLAASHGKGGETYFITDGEPVELRSFVTRMLATQGVDPGSKSMPKNVVLALARVSEWVWDIFDLKGTPPVTRMAVHLFGEPVTVNDAKARRELGYVGRMTREAGLAGLKTV